MSTARTTSPNAAATAGRASKRTRAATAVRPVGSNVAARTAIARSTRAPASSGIATERNSTILFPVPLELLTPFLQAHTQAVAQVDGKGTPGDD